VIFGLGAALGWGFADVGAAVVGRRLGSFATVLIAQVTSLIVITAVFLAVAPDTARLGEVAGWLIPNGLLAAVAYFTLYRGLELGPVSVVSPILASYAVVPVLLSFALLHEHVSAGSVAGIVVTIAGVVLTSTDLRALRSAERENPKGLPWALASALLFGLSAYVFGWGAHRAGWLPALWLSRTSTTVVFLVVLAVFGSQRRRLREAGAAGMWLATAVGAADLVGMIAYARGAEVGLLSIVSAASATYALIPVIVSIWLLKERPAPNQIAGVIVVVGGLLLLGLM